MKKYEVKSENGVHKIEQSKYGWAVDSSFKCGSIKIMANLPETFKVQEVFKFVYEIDCITIPDFL